MVDLAMVDQGFRNLWWIYRLDKLTSGL